MVSRTWRRILGAVPPARHLPRAVRAVRAAASVAAGASVAGCPGRPTFLEPPPCRSKAHAPVEPGTAKASEEEVEELLSRSKTVLFMKGSPELPRCRFSRLAAGQAEGAPTTNRPGQALTFVDQLGRFVQHSR
ncbi:unnamed protein product [Durusdinium trenchii]|uniref:Glutaredoxin-like protein n=1 Tax=Durusdinium trenchii TaxID=1381693 RepID=A0ABP0KM29_9DINO